MGLNLKQCGIPAFEKFPGFVGYQHATESDETSITSCGILGIFGVKRGRNPNYNPDVASLTASSPTATSRTVASSSASSTASSPIVDASSPIVDAPSSIVNAPSSIVNAPSPIVDAPSPIIDAPSPIIDAPSPIIDAPSPIVDAPSPIVDAPSHIVDAPSSIVDASSTALSIAPSTGPSIALSPQDCVGSWSNTCDINGMETFTITQQAQNGGSACSYNHNQQRRLCPSQDCVGSWSNTCDVNGMETYAIESQSQYGGIDCPFNDGQQRRLCPPQNCQGSWSACGTDHMKTYNVSTPALYGGTSCVDSTDSSIILTGNEKSYSDCHPETNVTWCAANLEVPDSQCRISNKHRATVNLHASSIFPGFNTCRIASTGTQNPCRTPQHPANIGGTGYGFPPIDADNSCQPFMACPAHATACDHQNRGTYTPGVPSCSGTAQKYPNLNGNHYMVFRLAPGENSRSTESKVVSRIEYNGHQQSFADFSNDIKFYVSTNDDPNVEDSSGTIRPGNVLCKHVTNYTGDTLDPSNFQKVSIECDNVMEGSYIKIIKDRNTSTRPMLALSNLKVYGADDTAVLLQPNVARTIFNN